MSIKTAQLIAQRLFDAGVRLQSAEDNGALLLMPQHLQSWVATEWLSSLQWDVEIVVSGIEVKTLGAQQAWLNAVFEDIQKSEFAAEIDHALWLIQCEYLDGKKAEARGALLKEQAA